jgi:hypothetical protein
MALELDCANFRVILFKIASRRAGYRKPSILFGGLLRAIKKPRGLFSGAGRKRLKRLRRAAPAEWILQASVEFAAS